MCNSLLSDRYVMLNECLFKIVNIEIYFVFKVIYVNLNRQLCLRRWRRVCVCVCV